MNRYTNSFTFNNNTYFYCDLKKIFEKYSILRKLPNSLKVLLELNIRNAQEQDITTTIATFVHRNHMKEICFYPSRVIMQDFAGIPALVDLASMRDKVDEQNGDVQTIYPKVLVDVVLENTIDENTIDKYEFIKWASKQIRNLSVIPPDSGICHQINLEYLSTMISSKQEDNKIFLYPETIIGTNSNTTTINALGVLGWEVHVIQAESSMFGEAIFLNLPQVIGVEVIGALSQGVNINDVALSLGDILKEHNVKNKIIEFYGIGLRNINIEDRAVLSNIVSKYKGISGYFGVDSNTIAYVEQTRGVDASLIKEYFIKQGMYDNQDLSYDQSIRFDLSSIKPVVLGPKNNQDKTYVKEVQNKFTSFKKGNFIKDNDIVLATISSTTSTSLIQAGLLAKKACDLGLNINKNIKRTIIPSSLVVKEYLERLDLLKYLEQLGFYIKGFEEDNTQLIERVSLDIDKFNLDVISVTSSSKNFEDKMHKQIKSNWSMSPALVIAYSLKGNMNFDITKDAIFQDIYLSDIWPSANEVNEYLLKIDYSIYKNVYKDIFVGNKQWQDLKYEDTYTYKWKNSSTYIQASPFFKDKYIEKIEIENAKILAILGDDISTEYIAPMGRILPYTSAALYLESKGLKPDEFDTFLNRRGNSQLMVRGIFSNIKLKNKIVSPKEGGFTKDFETGEIMPIYDLSEKMQNENIPSVVFAGNNYGIGDSTDWASKGIKLLGVKVIIAKSFDNTHRLNLISMGILPLEFIDDDIDSLYLRGDEVISIKTDDIKPNTKIQIEIKKTHDIKIITLQSRLDSKIEVNYYKNAGVLAYLLKNLIILNR